MASLALSLGAGVLFGLAMVAPPGPMNAVIADESVTHGWVAGATAGLGAMTADACFFLLTFVGIVRVVDRLPTLRAAMLAAGGVLMLYFAYDAYSTSVDGGGTPANDVGDGTARRSGFVKAFVLALTNPYQILFWLTVGVGMLQPGTLDVLAPLPLVGDQLAGTIVVRTGGPALVAGFFAGIAAWVVGFPATLVTVGRRVESFGSAVASASAIVLALFGVWFVADAVTTVVR